jgi:hypothetical protein
MARAITSNAYRLYRTLAVRFRMKGWFYSWFDAQSGTLRFSMSGVEKPSELPFACRLDIQSDPKAVAEQAIGSQYAAGIPKSELERTLWIPPSELPEPITLTVYVQELVPEY